MTITPRALDVDLAAVPRAWLGGDPVATAISNGVSMLFPHGERFFVRSVKHFLDRIDDPKLRADVKAFFHQEGHHAKAHDDYNAVLRAQGYRIDQFLGVYERLSSWLEAHLPAKVNLAGTAAAEHFTAIMAAGAFTGGMFDTADPRMQRLLAWHAAEEIEHKAVAFDVLQAVDPSYALRMVGLVYATVSLGAFWFAAATMLLRQDGFSWRRAGRHLDKLRDKDPILRTVFLRGIREYVRRGFHPNDNRDEGLAAAWFKAHGMELAA